VDISAADKKKYARRLNTICPYFTMFPLAFPYQQLRRAKRSNWVLDPFCGRGTTNYAARLLNIPSIGVDSSPVAVAIAQSKFVQARPADIVRVAKVILSQNRDPEEVPNGAFWKRCYHSKTLAKLCILREELIKTCESPARIALRAILLGSLHGPRYNVPSYLSNQMPRTYATKPRAALKFWKKKRLFPEPVDVLPIIARKASYFFGHAPAAAGGKAIQADSRQLGSLLKGYHFDWVITSPPYLGMRTYIPDQWVRNWFLGGPPIVDYRGEDQLGLEGKTNFTSALASVWRGIAPHCNDGARLVIRFGALPSLKVDSRTILCNSLKDSGSWRVLTIKNAGKATKGNRQASQFKAAGHPLNEIDLHAILEK